jgi:hypothetical protein
VKVYPSWMYLALHAPSYRWSSSWSESFTNNFSRSHNWLPPWIYTDDHMPKQAGIRVAA